MKNAFILLAFWLVTSGPLLAESLAERARTEEPTCTIVDDAYELCLVDGIIVAQSSVVLGGFDDGMAFFGSGSGIVSQATHISKDRGLSTLENYDVGPVDPSIPITDLGPLGFYDYGTFTFSAPIPELPGPTPYIVSLLDLETFDVFVISSFPNYYGLPQNAVLSEEQLGEHEELLTAFQPIKGNS